MLPVACRAIENRERLFDVAARGRLACLRQRSALAFLPDLREEKRNANMVRLDGLGLVRELLRLIDVLCQ